MQQPTKAPIGLYTLFLQRLGEAKKIAKKDIIPFPDLYQKLCPAFSIKKPQCFELLQMLRDFGIIEIVPFHGVRLKGDNSVSKLD